MCGILTLPSSPPAPSAYSFRQAKRASQRLFRSCSRWSGARRALAVEVGTERVLGNREAFDRLKALGGYGQPRPAADDRTTTMAAMQVADLMSPRSDGS